MDKTTLVDNKGKIELCVKGHFSNIGKDLSVDSSHRAIVADFLEWVSTENISGQNMFSLSINRKSVIRIVHELKSGKAVGTDEVPNEFLKFGGDTIVNTLIDLFVAICDLESIPSEWQKGIIIPIHKSGSVYDIDNYRGITLTSNVYKVFAKVLESNIMTFLEDYNILGENQSAFRRDRRIEDHLFTLNGVCASRKAAKLKTYVAISLICRKLSIGFGVTAFFTLCGITAYKVKYGGFLSSCMVMSVIRSYSASLKQSGVSRSMA